MDSDISRRMRDAGVELLEQSAPRHPYEVATRAADVVYFSGKTAMRDGGVVYTGPLRENADITRGQEAARLCVVQLLSAIESVVGLEHVERVLKITVFVSSAPTFTAQPEVANAASDLLIAVLGESGRHARSAVGVAALPGDSTVEVEAVVQVVGEQSA